MGDNGALVLCTLADDNNTWSYAGNQEHYHDDKDWEITLDIKFPIFKSAFRSTNILALTHVLS